MQSLRAGDGVLYTLSWDVVPTEKLSLKINGIYLSSNWSATCLLRMERCQLEKIMKQAVFVVLTVFAFGQGIAMAACPHIITGPSANALSNAGIKVALGGAGKYHCAIRVNEKWNESLGAISGTGNNAASGTLTDYKKGTNPSDPTGTVGSWSIDNGRIAYNYGPSQVYTYTVRQITAGSSYELCNVSTNELFTVSVSSSPTASATSCP